MMIRFRFAPKCAQHFPRILPQHTLRTEGTHSVFESESVGVCELWRLKMPSDRLAVFLLDTFVAWNHS